MTCLTLSLLWFCRQALWAKAAEAKLLQAALEEAAEMPLADEPAEQQLPSPQTMVIWTNAGFFWHLL